MPDSTVETNRLLAEILTAIQKLDISLRTHEQRIKELEAIGHSEEAPETFDEDDVQSVSPLESEHDGEETFDPPMLTYPEALYSGDVSPGTLEKRDLRRAYWSELIGDAWTLPADHRIELGFHEADLEGLSSYDARHRLEQLQTFNSNLLGTKTPLQSEAPKRRNYFRNFTIEDNIPYPPFYAQTYTIGQMESRAFPQSSPDAFTNPLKNSAFGAVFDREAAKSATYANTPWQRLITLQGLSSVILNNSSPSTKWRDKPYQSWRDACPFLMSYDKEVCGAVDAHLSCERRDFQSRGFSRKCGILGKHSEYGASLTFHITFYEIYLHGMEGNNDLWKVGQLYNDPKKRWFRECACTILARSSRQIMPTSSTTYPSRPLYPHWTILILTPEGFGKPERAAVGHMDLAVLSLITTSLHKITGTWSVLVDFLRALLEGEKASLLDPVRHDHLLFDNEDFSKSRQYFWAINCLAEFDSCISANIEQWEEFRRYLGVVDGEVVGGLGKGKKAAGADGNSGQLRELLERADASCSRLRRYQRFFQSKRAATVALRDGLFNASSVMESRAATRLGENIKLLTFVSVFFLPLSFCTSLWSTSNGPSSPTTLTYTTILVGLLTYLIVFNINLLVNSTFRTYSRYKALLVQGMRGESDERWRARGECFDVFRPNTGAADGGKRKPTEWVVLGYLLWRRLVRPWRRSANADDGDDGDGGGGKRSGDFGGGVNFGERKESLRGKGSWWGQEVGSRKRGVDEQRKGRGWLGREWG